MGGINLDENIKNIREFIQCLPILIWVINLDENIKNIRVYFQLINIHKLVY